MNIFKSRGACVGVENSTGEGGEKGVWDAARHTVVTFLQLTLCLSLKQLGVVS